MAEGAVAQWSPIRPIMVEIGIGIGIEVIGVIEASRRSG